MKKIKMKNILDLKWYSKKKIKQMMVRACQSRADYFSFKLSNELEDLL